MYLRLVTHNLYGTLGLPPVHLSQGIPLVSISHVRGGVPLVQLKTVVSSNKMMDSPPVFASMCAPSSLSKRYWRGTGNPSDPSSDEGGDPREGEGGGEMPQGKGTADGFNVPSPVSLPSSPEEEEEQEEEEEMEEDQEEQKEASRKRKRT